MAGIGRYRYEHIFIDNGSSDRTVEILKRIAADDTNVRLIVNARNFGHIRSPMYGAFQGSGDAIDRDCGRSAGPARDDPRLYPRVGERVLHGSVPSSGPARRTPLMFWIRKKYYRLINRLSSH